MRTAVLLAITAACSPATPPLDPPACDAAKLGAAVDALPSLNEGARPSALLHGVAEACDDPELGRLFDVAPASRAAAVTYYVRAHPDRWTAGCPAGVKPLAEIAPLPTAERTTKLHALCDLQRFGWSLARSRIMGERIPVGIIVAGRLSTSDPTQTQRVLDALAGK